VTTGTQGATFAAPASGQFWQPDLETGAAGGGGVVRGHGLAWNLRLAAVRYRFEESLFLFPALVMLGGIVLAILATTVDDALGHGARVPLTLAMNSNARPGCCRRWQPPW
jgi:hypothetical protein